MYNDRYILIFGGIHEVTYELNDLHIFDLVKNRWFLVNEDDKNAS